MTDPRHNVREVRAPRGDARTCLSWMTEAPMRMLMNNLDAEVAENPHELVVYGGIGRAARTWDDFDSIVSALTRLTEDETLLVQSGRPVGVFRTHPDAPRVLIANSNLVPNWATWDHFGELDRKGLMMYGQMTAGSWIYIGTQGILQGTYETFAEAARQHAGGDLRGKLVVSGGLGGMGGAQPLAATMNDAVFLGAVGMPSDLPDHVTLAPLMSAFSELATSREVTPALRARAWSTFTLILRTRFSQSCMISTVPGMACSASRS